MKFFYDTEFLEDGLTIDLISIGIVSDSSDELYLVNYDMDYVAVQYHPWLKENVWPYLPISRVDLYTGVEFLDPSHPAVQPYSVIRDTVRDFLTKDLHKPGHWSDVELWAYYGAYDHVALAQLFGSMVSMPKLLPRFTHELMQLWEDSGKPEKPPKPENAHCAIDDARWNYELYKKCKGS